MQLRIRTMPLGVMLACSVCLPARATAGPAGVQADGPLLKHVAIGRALALQAGGQNPGGQAPGGNAPGGTSGGQSGGQTPGGQAPGGNAPGGASGGQTGGQTPGGQAPGGNAPGGNVPGGQAPGGNAPGGNVPGAEPYQKPLSAPFVSLRMTPYSGIGAGFRQTGRVLARVGTSAVFIPAGEVELLRSNTVTETTLLGGGMVLVPQSGRYVPFADVMAGVSFCCSSTDLTLHFGGGADVDINRSYWLRVALAYRRVFYEGGSDGSLGVRVGVVMSLPGR